MNGAELHILAADVGGTHARFAACEVDAQFRARLGPVFRLETQRPGIGSFSDFWAAFRQTAPPGLAAVDAFDAVALAVAGAVDGGCAVLPNIEWDIRPAETRGIARLHLLNDFVAQGYALAAMDGTAGLDPVRGGTEIDGAVAVVGAGTGLGHCVLHRNATRGEGALPWTVSSSEAGHATFAFHGQRERAIEERLLQLCGKTWLSNDDVVSGRGAARLHAALTGQSVSPSEALAASHTETFNWFARFYARACRNFCLNVFPVRRLVLSGGLAARNPELVRAAAFSDEFDDSGDSRLPLQRIPIWLNTDQDIGIRGAGVYAAVNLLRAGRGSD